MKKKLLYFTFGITLILIAYNWSRIQMINKFYINPCYYDKPVKQMDFPQVFFEIDLKEYYTKIKSFSNNVFTVDTIESIIYKEQSYPILEITKRASETISQNKLLVLAGVHGNESGGTLAILELLQQIDHDRQKYKNWTIKIISPINPAGTIEMSRYNECGCDLNRKVSSSSQKGIVLQRKILESFEPDVIVTMHEAPSDGFLIHTNNRLDTSLLNQLLKDSKMQGIELSTVDYLGRELEVAGSSKVKGGLKFLKNLVQVQTLGDYASEKNIIEITTESGWNSQDTFQRVNSHLFVISSLIEHY